MSIASIFLVFHLDASLCMKFGEIEAFGRLHISEKNLRKTQLDWGRC